MIRGLRFSPNDSFLYISKSYNIYQYEWSVMDSNQAWHHVKQGMDTTFLQFAEYGPLQAGIDGRIYIGKRGGTGNSNSVIDYPNLKGNACSFCQKCLRMDTTQWYTQSLANMPNFNMPKKEPCWPLQTGQLPIKESTWTFYPNPATQQIFITKAQGKRKVLYNTVGQVLVSTNKDEVEVGGLRSGVYYLYCEGRVKKVIVE